MTEREIYIYDGERCDGGSEIYMNYDGGSERYMMEGERDIYMMQGDRDI